MKEGALIIYHEDGTDNILLGKEGKYIWDEDPLTVEHLNAQRIHHSKIDLKDFKVHENLTKEVVKKVRAQLNKENPSSINFLWLVPPVVKSSVQKNAPEGQITYSSHARKERRDTGYGPPKGGAESGETSVDTILREIQEEIGNLDKDILPKKSDEYDKTTDEKAYTIFYKKVTSAQAREIEQEIQRRYAEHIGEMFDLKFRNKDEGNSLTKEALSKIKAQDDAEAAKKAKPKNENVRTTVSKGTAGRPGSSWGIKLKTAASGPKKSPSKGGKRYTRKQRKNKKGKKHTRRR